MSTRWTVFYKKVLFNVELLRTKLKYSIMPFYAVAKGRTSGIFMSWTDCEAQVKGFPGARYKKFDTVVAAQEFINSVGNNNTLVPKSKPQFNTTQSFAGSSNNTDNNLKRSYLKTAQSPGYEANKSKSKTTKKVSSDDSDGFSDGSDDLNSMLTKQLDDVEKRLKSFEKGVDKIIKKSTKTTVKKTIVIEPPQPKKKRLNSGSEFEEDNDGFVKVFTDGACSANGKNGAKAGIGVYWGDGHPHNVSEPVSGRATNNCGEIQAATKAIKIALQNGITKLAINTDSKFLINSATKWMSGWKRKGWKLKSGEPVKNEVDFKDLDSVQNKLAIKWNYVEAHRGIHGNEMADQLARAGAIMYEGK